MSFLAFLGIMGAMAYGISSESKSAAYKGRKQAFLKDINYDVNINRDFLDICYVCGVRQKATNTHLGLQCNNNPPVWPKGGYQKCIPFLKEQPQLTKEDIELFKKIYNQKRRESLDNLQKAYDESYEDWLRIFRKEEDTDVLRIFTKKHWDLFSVKDHQKMTNDIYYNTFWNEIATGPAKIIDEGFGKRREIWQVKNYRDVNSYYHRCLDKCGYNTFML